MESRFSPPFSSSTTASFLVTNNTTGTIQFDVTKDIKAFLNGTPNYGWIIKKIDEDDLGLIDFSSRETAHPPVLMIRYAGE